MLRLLLCVFLINGLTCMEMAEWEKRYKALSEKVDAVARQIMLQQMSLEEQIRTDSGSGVKQLRHYTEGTRPYHSNSHSGFAPLSMHEHANLDRTVGTGEFIAVLNGVDFRTRHNDYKLHMPHPTSNRFHHTVPMPFPEVPPAVLAKKTVDEQVKEMRLWFKAFNDQDYSKRDYRKYFKPVLCYLEGWWSTNTKTLNEPFLSDRHFIDAESWFDLFEKVRFTAYNGRKSLSENYAFLPTSIQEMRNGTLPVFAQWNYRINCHPLKKDLPLNRLHPVDDLHVRMAYGRTMQQHILSRSTRFEINPLNTGAWPYYERYFHQRWSLLDDLMSEVPGKDNYQGKIYDDAFGYPAVHMKTKQKLNTAYYHRSYMVERTAGTKKYHHFRHRSYSDPNVFFAQTTQNRVASQTLKDCRRKPCKEYTQRWTYAVPLEIIYMTPLLSWNPYDLQLKDFRDKSITAGGRNGKLTPKQAYNGTSTRTVYYRTPRSFFSGAEVEVNPADTARGLVGVLDKKGVVRAVRASGIRIFLPKIDGVGIVRVRYPIFPIAYDGNSAYKQMEALKDIVMEQEKYLRMYREVPKPATKPPPTKPKPKNPAPIIG